MSAVGMTAQEYGKENSHEIAALLGRSIFIALIGAILLLVLQVPICRLTFIITKGEAEVEAYAQAYFNIRIWAAPATIALMALTGWFIGLQDAKTPMLIAIVVNLTNIGTSYFLVSHYKMGAEGVALGTVIGQYSGLALALFILFSKYKKYLVLLKLAEVFQFKLYKRFFNVNIDIFIRTFAVITVLTWYNFVSAEKGETILGINVIFLQLVYAFSFFIDGFANAAEALSGRYFGAAQKENLRKVVKHIFGWGIGIALIFTVAYFFAWKPIMRIYTKDVLLIEQAADYVGWIIAIPLISILTFIWDGIFLGATATAEQRNATVVAACCFFATYYGLKTFMGNHALLMAQLVFFGMRGILQSFLYKRAVLNKI